MHVQTIPKSPPKIIVQVANESCDFFFAPSRATSEARGEHASTEILNFRCKCERWRLMRGARLRAEPRARH